MASIPKLLISLALVAAMLTVGIGAVLLLVPWWPLNAVLLCGALVGFTMFWVLMRVLGLVSRENTHHPGDSAED